MAHVVKCCLCGKITLHHWRCIRQNGFFPCPSCCPDFDKDKIYPLDSWVVIGRLSFSAEPREYHLCCSKQNKE